MEVRLSGCYTFASRTPAIDDIAGAITATIRRVCLLDDGITEWDSALLMLLMKLRARCVGDGIEIDLSGLPDGVQQLIRLATAVPAREDSRSGRPPNIFAQVGRSAVAISEEATAMLQFLGEITAGVGRLLTGRAKYRKSDLWLNIQQCGPEALGIVTTISVLVGAILAFVGAIQLKMFGAEIYVANLVGIGMVMEMGALMTGIILAGRTGAAFAAQLGTMQVNEEIDALKTMGILPVDYLVLPRMVALVIMTPLLILYADLMGILGGAVVGIFALDIPTVLFFDQTFEMMTLWHCAQGLIKGMTFGVLVALAGCLRGMQCGRSASAVGDAATSAVVTAIVMIVLADAVWTFIFMTTG